ncbi:plastidic glucose transporter 4, partial [Tanacetum coccineum]
YNIQLLQCLTQNVETIIIGRLLSGFGIGISSAILWWRGMFGIAVIPSVLLALGMAFSAESPRWLVQQRKIPQAEQAIIKLYGKSRVTELIADLSASSQGSEELDAGWFDLFSRRYFKL